MEKERGSKVIAIISLVIAVVGLSVGFAAYTSMLTISNTSATVGAADEEDFSVIFSTNDGSDDITITNLLTTAQVSGGAQAILATNEEGDTIATMSGTVINGLSAIFTQPGQKVTYTIYSHNTGKFLAYLNSLTIGEKTCTANTGATQSLVDTVCPSITMNVQVNSDDTDVDNIETQTSIANIGEHTLAIGDYEEIIIELEYASTDARSDGDFTVNFGQIDLTYEHKD